MSEMKVYGKNNTCGICGTQLKQIEVTDEEKTTPEKWITKMSDPLCRNHNPWIGWDTKEKKGSWNEQIQGFVQKINEHKITVKRKTPYFMAHKTELGITRY